MLTLIFAGPETPAPHENGIFMLIMVTAGDDGELIVVNDVYQSVTFIDTPRPEAGKILF